MAAYIVAASTQHGVFIEISGWSHGFSSGPFDGSAEHVMVCGHSLNVADDATRYQRDLGFRYHGNARGHKTSID